MSQTICKILEQEDGVKIKFRIDGEIVYKEIKFTNYFYIRAEEFEQVSYLVDPRAKQLTVVTDKNNNEYYRIYLKSNLHRNMLRNDIEEAGVETFEADILAGKRILIDNPDFDLHQEGLRIAFYDIETDDRKPFVKDKKGDIVPETPILSIALKEFNPKGDEEVWYRRNRGLDGDEFDGYRKLRKEFLELKKEGKSTKEVKERLDEWDEQVTKALVAGEKFLLEEYFDHVVQFDVVSAWNETLFDDPYVRARAKVHRAISMREHKKNEHHSIFKKYDDLNLVGFDYLESYRKNQFDPAKSFKLNDVAFKELASELDNPESKLEHPEEIKKVDWKSVTNAEKYFDLFLLFPSIHQEYNEQDVHLLDMMEKKLNFFKLHFVQCRKAHCLLIDTLYNSRICDIMVLNESRKRNIVKISKPTQVEVKKREKTIPTGGFVYANSGYYENVEVFDFASLYPTIGITFDISPELFIRSQAPDLSSVFTPEEQMYVEYCVKVAEEYIDKMGKLAKKKYEKDIEEKRKELGVDPMETLMWKFVEHYDQKIAVAENEVYTPADLNYNTRGWGISPHYVFDGVEEGIYPQIYKELLIERNQVKYALKNLDKDTFEFIEKYWYQWGLKILANCFSTDTEIMTVDGVKNICDVKKGDKVYSLNMETNEVEVATVIEEIRQPHTGHMVHFKNKNTDLLVTPNHRMVRQRYTTKKNWFCEAQDCVNGINVPTHHNSIKRQVKKKVDLLEFVNASEYEVFNGKVRRKPDYENEFTKRGINNHKWFDRYVPTDFFSKVVGWYIADGSLHKTSENGFGVSIAKYKKTKEWKKIHDELCRIGHVSISKKNLHFASSIWYHVLEKFGTHGYKKCVPKEFKEYLDYEILFEAMYECDGNKNQWRYNTTSDHIKDFLKEVCFLLNRSFNATLEPNGKNKPCWRIFCQPLKKNRRVHKETITKRYLPKKCNEVACITLDKNNTVYAGRNDTFIWTSQSLYGFTGFRGGRDYRFELPDAITTSGRHLVKKATSEARKKGYVVSFIDTDSTNGRIPEGMTVKDFDKFFAELYDNYLGRFNLKCKYPHGDVIKNHAINLEHEKTYEELIVVKKKRYYYMNKGKIDGKGGTQTRSDVLQLAKDLQKQLLEDIFLKKMDKNVWKQKLFDLKKKVENFELEEEHLVRISGLGKPIEEYGQPVIDASTGLQKLRKSDGAPMFSPIPANVQVAKKLIAEGENIDVGDKIPFVILKEKPRIHPITLKEFRDNKKYDTGYYYSRIIKPVIEVLSVVHPDEVYTFYKDCWMFTDRQIKTLVEKMKEEDDEE